jgi:hypothetical protein
MAKVMNFQKSRTPRSPDDLSDTDIDLKRGAEGVKTMERVSPKFQEMMDRIRRAAKAVGRNMKMFLMLALTIVLSRHK